MSDWSPGGYSKSSPGSGSDTWEATRLIKEVLRAIGAASAANFGFRDDTLLLEGLENTDQTLPYLYRIGGSYSLATALLELHCEETGQSALKVLQDLGLKANATLAAYELADRRSSYLRHPSQYTGPQDPDEDPPPPLEPV